VGRIPAIVGLSLLVAACSVIRIGTPGELDLNAADAAGIARLPGLTRADGDRIVAHRPYTAKEDLLRRGVLDAAQYEAVADHLYVGPPGMPDYLRATPPQPEGP